jgi:hypothetical protein
MVLLVVQPSLMDGLPAVVVAVEVAKPQETLEMAELVRLLEAAVVVADHATRDTRLAQVVLVETDSLFWSGCSNSGQGSGNRILIGCRRVPSPGATAMTWTLPTSRYWGFFVFNLAGA